MPVTVARERPAATAVEVPRVHDLALRQRQARRPVTEVEVVEVGVERVEAGVENGDPDAGAGHAPRPPFRRPDVGGRPAGLVREWVVVEGGHNLDRSEPVDPVEAGNAEDRLAVRRERHGIDRAVGAQDPGTEAGQLIAVPSVVRLCEDREVGDLPCPMARHEGRHARVGIQAAGDDRGQVGPELPHRIRNRGCRRASFRRDRSDLPGPCRRARRPRHGQGEHRGSGQR
jgi:hypothetical protein